MRRLPLAASAGVLLALAGGGWYGYAVWWPAHCLDRLAHGPAEQADTWAARVAGSGADAGPRLLGFLFQYGDDPQACGRARDALTKLAASWPADDPRGPALVQGLADDFNRLGEWGQLAALELANGLSAGPVPGSKDACGEMVAHALTQTTETVRAKAVGVLMARPDLGPPAAVVDRLSDPSPVVRRVAMLAVGPTRDLIGDDDLLKWLHDPDPGVRSLCETALRARGLRSEDVRMGRLLTDSRPTVRLELLPYLQRGADVSVDVWLRRLTLDAAPSVRAAAVRAAAEQQVAALADRLAEMAASDPDPSVRANAQFYLGRLRPERPAAYRAPR